VVTGRGEGLGGEGIHHCFLEGGRDPVDRDWLVSRAIALDLAQHGRLETGEAEIVGTRRARSREPRRRRRVARRRADGGSTRIWQAEQPPDLVERLARRVVDGLAEQRVAPMVVHQHELGVAAADDEAEQRERRFGRLRGRGIAFEQPVGVDMTLDMVHADEGQIVAHRQRLGDVDADQQRADQAGPARHRHRVEILPAGTGLLERRLEGGHDPAQLLAGGHLRHDPAGGRVQGHLARDLVRLDAPPADHDGHAGLVARRLDRQDPRAAHPASRSRSAAMIELMTSSPSSGVVITSASSPSSV
jgi:hypothetical protein